MESLQKHVDQIGAQYKIITVTPEVTVSSEEHKKKKCSKCEKDAEYFGNFLGTEKLLCKKHAVIFEEKNSSLPDDLWFCKPI